MNDTDKLIKAPKKAGQYIVEDGAIIACPLLGTDRFVEFCKKRGLSITRKRLIHIETLGLFSPIFRVKTPDTDIPLFHVPINTDNNWFLKGYAWDTTNVPHDFYTPVDSDRGQEGYYSIFQIDYLSNLLDQYTLQIELDSYLTNHDEKVIDWHELGTKWLHYAEMGLEEGKAHEFRRSIALLCQFISSRYFPKTQTNQRTFRSGNNSYSDHWINVNGFQWDWYEYVRTWKPSNVEKLLKLTPDNLRHAYETISRAQSWNDPIEKWHQLVQFISVRERERLKGKALFSETLRSGAHMLRMLYMDLYGHDLPDPNDVSGTIIKHAPELEVRQDVRRYLELVVNRFHLNPQPTLSLFVEGQTEEAAITSIFEEYFGTHLGTYGIEIIVLGSVDNATGSKREDRFRAIFRLIDYLHHHQTFAFLILDNENYAMRLKKEAHRTKSIHSKQRYVTRPEYIRIWKDTFEFDNFSCSEIASAMSELSKGSADFRVSEVSTCKKSKNPGSKLQDLYHTKTQYGLEKIKLSEILIKTMLSPNSRRKIENRPIIKILQRVAQIAARNPFPVLHESWEKNQASKYLGKKRSNS